MAERVNVCCLLALLVASVLFQGIAAQMTHIVGDSLGWVIPPDSATYANWASQRRFIVDDIIVFNFAPGAHDVTEVTKEGFDACSAADPKSTTTTAPASITLSIPGEHYFICSFPGHCAAGQKLAVTVGGSV